MMYRLRRLPYRVVCRARPLALPLSATCTRAATTPCYLRSIRKKHKNTKTKRRNRGKEIGIKMLIASPHRHTAFLHTDLYSGQVLQVTHSHRGRPIRGTGAEGAAQLSLSAAAGRRRGRGAGARARAAERRAEVSTERAWSRRSAGPVWPAPRRLIRSPLLLLPRATPRRPPRLGRTRAAA